MAREKKPVHKVVMTEGKRSIIQQLLQEYDIQSAEDIQEALKDLLGGTIKEMMEAEMDEHLGYQKSQRSDSDDYRNGYKSKRVNSSYGTMDIQVPQDRKSTFEPQVVRKRQKDISSIDQKIISMYAKGMTTRQISETLEDIYGFEASEGFISDVTDKILPQIEDWQKRPLSEIYPVLYIDAIHYSVRDNGVIRKLAAYVILGINLDGQKEVLTIQNDVKWAPMNGAWEIGETSAVVDTPYAYASALSENDVPHQGCLAFDFTFSEGTERFAVALQVDEEFARGYYFYLDPKRQRLEYKSAIRMHEQGGWTFQYDVELERPLELIPGKTYSMEIYIDESVMEVYVGGTTALSVRAYDLHDRKFGLAVSDGKVRFENIQLTTMGG